MTELNFVKEWRLASDEVARLRAEIERLTWVLRHIADHTDINANECPGIASRALASHE
jgi:hypothetical protein